MGPASLDSARLTGDESLLAGALMTTGIARSQAGDAAGGLKCFAEVMRVYDKLGAAWTAMVSVLNNMGINCKNLGRLEEPAEHLRRAEAQAALTNALASFDDEGHRGFECHARHLLGQVLRGRGQEAEVQSELTRALALAEAQSRLEIAARMHLALCDLHRDAERFEQALRHHEAESSGCGMASPRRPMPGSRARTPIRWSARSRAHIGWGGHCRWRCLVWTTSSRSTIASGMA